MRPSTHSSTLHPFTPSRSAGLRGIDVGAKAEIYELVAQLASQGVSFIVVSSELPELLGMCDRIVVLCEGKITAEFDAGTATQEDLLTAAMPIQGQAVREDAPAVDAIETAK